jgi:hypothetical protein
MLKPIANIIGAYLAGSHGPVGRVQGVLVALSLSLGLVQLCRIGLAVDLFFWRHFIRPAKKLKKYGSWAAVTGATDGIGRAYCDELAKQGVNCVRGHDLCNARSTHSKLMLLQRILSIVSS